MLSEKLRKVKNLFWGVADDEDGDWGEEEEVVGYGEQEQRRERRYDERRNEEKRFDEKRYDEKRYERAGSDTRTGRQESYESAKIVNYPGSEDKLQVLIEKPADVGQAAELCDHFKMGNIIVVNLEDVEKPLAQRIADFLGGAVYVMNGEIERISDDIFVMGPAHIPITSEFRRELKNEFKFSNTFVREPVRRSKAL